MQKKIAIKSIFAYFGIVILVRLFTMWRYPLTDTTEARYGELARKMVETGDWITPWFDYGIPFWAKPPLSTWTSAFSMQIFGINEFIVRLPTLIIATVLLYIFWIFSRSFLDKINSLLALVILTSMALFYFVAGTVMTDMVLMFAVVLVLISFWFAVEQRSKKWGYLFFVGLGLSLLAKGPVAIVLGLLPIFFWLVLTNRWKNMFSSLPWIGGILLMLAIGVPWYVLAEIKTPGFLNYFIVGEHINRFLVTGWSGDLYGNAHPKQLGTIWVFLLADAFPWIFIVIPLFIYRRFKKTVNQNIKFDSGLSTYLWCWFLVPLIFFTFAKNIIMTYAITALPALAILITQSISSISIHNGTLKKWVYTAGMFTPVLLMISIIYTHKYPKTGKISAVNISQTFHKIKEPNAHPLIYIGKRLYSMEFYNNGKVLRFDTFKDFQSHDKSDEHMYIALNKQQTNTLTVNQIQTLTRIATTPIYVLYKYNKRKDRISRLNKTAPKTSYEKFKITGS